MKNTTSFSLLLVLAVIIIAGIYFTKSPKQPSDPVTPSVIRSTSPEPTPHNDYIPHGELNDKG